MTLKYKPVKKPVSDAPWQKVNDYSYRAIRRLTLDVATCQLSHHTWRAVNDNMWRLLNIALREEHEPIV